MIFWESLDPFFKLALLLVAYAFLLMIVAETFLSGKGDTFIKIAGVSLAAGFGFMLVGAIQAGL